MKVKFCCPGRSAPPSLLNATQLMAPIRKDTNVCGSALKIMTGLIIMLKMIRSDVLTASTHLDTVHSTQYTVYRTLERRAHSIK